MGAGKSFLGKRLSELLSRRFVDTDDVITAREQQSITVIFEGRGESVFRRIECDLLAELATQQDLIVSVGGGAILAPTNRECLSRGVWIYLDTPLEVLLTRVRFSSQRPLATSQENLRALFYEREALYRQAPIHIECANSPLDFLCEKIIKTLK